MGLKIKGAAPAAEVAAAGKIKAIFHGVEEVLLSSLKGHDRNSRVHDESQLAALVSSIKTWGWTIPLVVNEEGVILAGHGRAEAARRAKLKKVTVVRVKGWDDFKQRAYMLADNQLALMSYWDFGMLSSEVDFLAQNDFSLDSLGMSAGAKAALSSYKMSNAPAPLPGSTGVPGAMAKKFGLSPFSVVSVGDAWWVQERAVWLSHGAVAVDMYCLFDLLLRWFCPLGGCVGGVFGDECAVVPPALGYALSKGTLDFVFLDYVSMWGDDMFAALDLNANRFVAVAVPAHTSPIEWACLLASAKEAGLRYYNEVVIDGMGNGEGVLPSRHVFVLLFIKGDERAASETIGAPNLVVLPVLELAEDPVINDPNEITPILEVGDIWMKRDDFFAIGTARGGKVRSCLAVSEGASGLVTAGSRASPQVNIVAQVAKKLGVPARAHLPQGALSPCVEETKEDIELVQHKAGYNSVIVKRARDDAASSGWREVPFGMETPIAVNCTRAQVRGIPEGVQRIILPVGSGMTLAGVLWGLLDGGVSIPVVGVVVGADPEERLNKYAPPNWKSMVSLVKSELDYHDYSPETVFRGVQLDPIYESKVIPFVEAGDLFWVVGIRSVL